ncbi:endo-1,4-beta-xylanase [Algoriphagus sp. C2-6-M1]|uniref:endo-1,4-beta-xylanase n=1 Tax=Algoriphagus persicinus TaxID=3108754 RepID=UPI002B386197|nr:endo-1,4-beta-xylanase [Algoriphagus sp. C2-6-M1]MEB2782638.1 endo-1,4-beta-xylanase [Algoriphagus sp. C2-6-M1]
MLKNTLLLITLTCVFSAQKPKSESLKDIFKNSFYVGVAVNGQQVSGKEPHAQAIIAAHFNSLSPENGLKWQLVHPEPDRYSFEFGDAYVALGEKIGAFTIGHCLVWHQQVPNWVFEDELGNSVNKDVLLSRMENHIEAVAGRYKGKIHGWDVVNEAFEEDGSFRNSKWYQIAGKDFIKEAFRKAHTADPEAELYYNDYNVWKASKRKGILDFAKEMKSEGIKVDAIGMQGHYQLDTPTLEEIEQGIIDIHEAGFKVMITELDVDVLPRPRRAVGADLNMNFANSDEYNPFKKGITPEAEARLAQRYADIFAIYEKHKEKISRVTFWGLHDGRSWLNNFPVRGRTNYPLLFDRNLEPKKAVFEKLASVVK